MPRSPEPEPTLEGVVAQLERERLFGILRELVRWENTTNEAVLERARAEIWQSWRRACAANAGHQASLRSKRNPRAAELFDRYRLPAFHDPFAGGGALPLEAQRLGLEAHASDLNPVAVLINKAMIEIPPKFAGRPPVNPETSRNEDLVARDWKGAQGLAEDVRYYGRWMRDEAERRIGHLYPKVEVAPEMVRERPDLKAYEGRKLTVIAWLWARTVRSPNPAFADVEVPLASTFMLSTKKGKEAYVEPVIEGSGYRFAVKVGAPADVDAAKAGTKLSRGASFRCLMSGTPIAGDYIKSEGKAGRMSARLMAVVAEGDRGRIYLAPTSEHEQTARTAIPEWRPESSLPEDPRNFWTVQYGLTTYADLFTPRQLVALTTFSDLVQEAREQVQRDAAAAGFAENDKPLQGGGTGTVAYADAVGVYLAFALSKALTRNCSQTAWYTDRESTMAAFSRQAIPMTWDFAEMNPLLNGTGSIAATALWVAEVLEGSLATGGPHCQATQMDAARAKLTPSPVISTDPPYYDNIGYADLSDFFYVWLRRSLKPVLPELFATLAVPKAAELVATPYRHGSREAAEIFFLDGMTLAMRQLSEQAHSGLPITIYYAFKQSERKAGTGVTSTGWETFLDAVIRSGFAITGTWPMRTEQPHGLRVIDSNALASSIVLVCRARPVDASVTTRREYLSALRSELPQALRLLQTGNVAPVDLAQAAIGPGMAVYTRYAKVLVIACSRPEQRAEWCGIGTSIVISRFFAVSVEGRKNHSGTTPTARRPTRDAHLSRPLIGYTKHSRSAPAGGASAPSDASRSIPVPGASYRDGALPTKPVTNRFRSGLKCRPGHCEERPRRHRSRWGTHRIRPGEIRSRPAPWTGVSVPAAMRRNAASESRPKCGALCNDRSKVRRGGLQIAANRQEV